MKDVDDAIGRVLTGLREVEAAPGLEGRVAAGVRRRMASGDRRTFSFFRSWQRAGMSVAGAAVLFAVVGVSVHRVARHGAMTTGAPQMRSTVERTSQTPSSGAGENVCRNGTAKAIPIPKTNLARNSMAVLPPRSMGRVESVSFPAPPLPLTEQERLLLRVANYGDPEEVAMLDPDVRAMQDAEETVVFQQFFGKPKRVEQTEQKANQVSQGENK